MSDNLPATSGSSVPASLDDDLMVGLEDFDVTDAVMPRLRIDGQNAVFEDNLSKATYTELDAVLLGLVKQRVLWDAEINEDGAPPLCKSVDHERGRPGEHFPWKASGFTEESLGEDGCLSCAACPLKEWGSHPSRDVPWCSEQFVFPLVTDDGPAILTIQRSGIKNARAYTSSFMRAKKPLFTHNTKITLRAEKRGSVRYAVPEFQRGEETDQSEWAELADLYRSVRGFLHTQRTTDEDGGGAPARGASPAPVLDDDEDVPF